ILAQGIALGQVVTEFTWYMRNLLLVQTSEDAQDELDMSAESMRLLREEAEMKDIVTLMRNIRIRTELSSNIRYASTKRMLIDIAFIKLVKPAMESDWESLLERIRVLETCIDNGVVAAAQKEASSIIDKNREAPSESGEVIELTEADYEDYKQLNTDW